MTIPGTKTISLAVTLVVLSGTGRSTASPVQQDDEAALLTAAREGRVDDVRTLLDQGLDVNARNEDDWTPLLFAAVGGHHEVVTLLLERGADVNVSNNVGWTPLIAAALSGQPGVMGLLLEGGADPQAKSGRTPDGDSAVTALIVAARYGYVEIVNLLLDGGAEVNARSRNGLTPLMAAASGGHTEVVTLLVERGADVSGVALAPLTARPEIRDRARAAQVVLRNYPRSLENAGIGGTVRVWVLISTDGRAVNAQVRQSSGNELLDQAALRVVREIEFTPARSDGVAVAVWVEFPIAFRASGAATVGPEFRDPWRPAEIIRSHHPRYLRDAGIGGKVYVKVFIDTEGRVTRAEVTKSSGHPALDRAALRAAREFLFAPARRDGVPIATWVTIPITFPRNY
jgi:TonB family protein